jgi:Lysozyme like domain
MTFHELGQLWVRAGGKPDEANLAASVALAESSGNPGAEGHNTNGTTDRGLWQINSIWGGLSTTDPLANARAAVKISSSGQGWGNWTTYKTGAYGKYLPGKGRQEPAQKTASGVADGNLTAVVPGLHKLTGWVGELLEGLGKLAVTGVLLLAGAVLVVYGIMIAVRPRESAFNAPDLSKFMPRVNVG